MTMQFDLEHDGFVGEFHPGARYPGKAVLYVGGASCDRKMTLAMGRFIEDAGFSVLYLGFYLWEGLPKEMWRIPVDYAERAAKWLISHGYEPCMMGASTGAGYTLLSASLIPEIHGAAALCPFDHVMEGMELLAGFRTARSTSSTARNTHIPNLTPQRTAGSRCCERHGARAFLSRG